MECVGSSGRTPPGRGSAMPPCGGGLPAGWLCATAGAPNPISEATAAVAKRCARERFIERSFLSTTLYSNSAAASSPPHPPLRGLPSRSNDKAVLAREGEGCRTVPKVQAPMAIGKGEGGLRTDRPFLRKDQEVERSRKTGKVALRRKRLWDWHSNPSI